MLLALSLCPSLFLTREPMWSPVALHPCPCSAPPVILSAAVALGGKIGGLLTGIPLDLASIYAPYCLRPDHAPVLTTEAAFISR